MPRSSPFAGLVDGPAPDAVTVEVGRPKAIAIGCFGVVTLFLAILAVAAFTYAAGAVVNTTMGTPGSLRVVAVVLGIVFVAIVIALIVITVKALRARQGLGFDERAVWWRDGAKLVELPWTDIAAARLVRPAKVRGGRSSVPVAPSVELYPTSVDTLREYTQLLDKVISGEPATPELPVLRFSFQLPDPATAEAVEAAMGRFAPAQLANGREDATE
ncbi:MAG TPA: hypothetical protein VJ914_32500 [Pseudonocardiaceae bacterium]|nr:hypothetical protein [Pseudonocardiaceae bacterium]